MNVESKERIALNSMDGLHFTGINADHGMNFCSSSST